MKTTLEAIFVERSDITFLMEHVTDSKGEAVSTEVVGFYYGKPDEEGNKMYRGKTKAEYK